MAAQRRMTHRSGRGQGGGYIYGPRGRFQWPLPLGSKVWGRELGIEEPAHEIQTPRGETRLVPAVVKYDILLAMNPSPRTEWTERLYNAILGLPYERLEFSLRLPYDLEGLLDREGFIFVSLELFDVPGNVPYGETPCQPSSLPYCPASWSYKQADAEAHAKANPPL